MKKSKEEHARGWLARLTHRHTQIMSTRTSPPHGRGEVNESTEARRDCAILTLAHETHQTDVTCAIRVKFDVMNKRRG